jgi:hypothetical protein
MIKNTKRTRISRINKRNLTRIIPLSLLDDQPPIELVKEHRTGVEAPPRRAGGRDLGPGVLAWEGCFVGCFAHFFPSFSSSFLLFSSSSSFSFCCSLISSSLWLAVCFASLVWFRFGLPFSPLGFSVSLG